MIIREFERLDTSNRKRIFAECKCSVCNSLYIKQKRQLNEYNTCSIQCTNVANGRTIVHNCDHCGELVFKAKSKAEASKSGKLFCSRECKEAAQKYMVEIQPEHYGTTSGIRSYREKAFKHYEPVCNKCGYTNIIALEVHHKDKNRDNNSIDNLEILCANCHTIEHRG
jgi:phage terminase large subunit GpA-like protein